MDELVSKVLLKELKENKTIEVVSLMKKLSYDMACNVLFDIDEQTREILFEDFITAFKAIHSLPINFPGTSFWRGQKARARIVEKILPIMNKRREELSKGTISSTNDMLSCLLAIRDENDEPLDDDIITDNFIFLFVASHDTSATLMSLMVWKLSRDQDVYHKVLEGNTNYLVFLVTLFVCVILSWFKIALAIIVTLGTFILWENVVAKDGP
jgi:cytochrome P450 family 26 subfamily A